MESEKPRYSGELIEEYDLLLKAWPHKDAMFQAMRDFLTAIYSGSQSQRINGLEIGCGSGEATGYLVQADPRIVLTASDIDPTMIERCSSRFDKYVKAGSLNVKQGNAFTTDYSGLDFIASSWTVHNFTRDQRKELFSRIYQEASPGTTLILMDKFIPDSPEMEKIMLDHMFREYDHLLLPLGKKDLCDRIKAHELQDHERPYRMTESEALDDLRSVGFSQVSMLPVRIWRDALAYAKK